MLITSTGIISGFPYKKTVTTNNSKNTKMYEIIVHLTCKNNSFQLTSQLDFTFSYDIDALKNNQEQLRTSSLQNILIFPTKIHMNMSLQ